MEKLSNCDFLFLKPASGLQSFFDCGDATGPTFRFSPRWFEAISLLFQSYFNMFFGFKLADRY